jgi:hypothetical protein
MHDGDGLSVPCDLFFLSRHCHYLASKEDDFPVEAPQNTVTTLVLTFEKLTA